ncbi:MAG: hypothetical protein JWN44_304 [Myxococcales bacterium]|nr:hypothetical protein [Myxococcales bacterium]
MRHGLTGITLAIAFLAGCGNTTSGGNGTVRFTASGEVLALGGYDFPPAAAGDAAFVDGWEVRFEKLIVVFDKVTLSEGPDTSPTDQSQVGNVVAQADGPWAIDLHAGGPLAGKGGSDEQAVEFAQALNMNKTGGGGFDPTVRYAFGFDSVPATAAATKINIAAGDADYADMVAKGVNVLYVGTATWKGGASCTSTNAAYDFAALPTEVHFKLGFKTPTTYANCQNPDNDPAQGVGGEDHQRGVQIKDNQQVTAQVTFHTDHPFWESFTHDSPAHFDMLAALAKKDASGKYNVTLDDTAGVNFTALKDATGAALPWRSCLADYTPPNSSAQMGFDSLTVPYNPAGNPSTSMRDLRDFLTYNQSTQGHLNSDGLCFVKRNYPSPQ